VDAPGASVASASDWFWIEAAALRGDRISRMVLVSFVRKAGTASRANTSTVEKAFLANKKMGSGFAARRRIAFPCGRAFQPQSGQRTRRY
jgi:hypothetical protein